MPKLESMQCTACKKGTPSLSSEGVTKRMAEIKDWKLSEAGNEISRKFMFNGFGKNYNQNMKLASLISDIVMSQNHHPRIVIEYNYVEVRFTTHAAKGLTENDFICAAKINQCVELNQALLPGLKVDAMAQVADQKLFSQGGKAVVKESIVAKSVRLI